MAPFPRAPSALAQRLAVPFDMSSIRAPTKRDVELGKIAVAALTRVAVPVQVWPDPKWQADPAGFVQNVLGQRPWEKQIEVLEALRDNPRVSVASGHKIGKSFIAADAAYWFYSAFEDARVIMTSSTARQVDAILWREVRKIYAKAGRCKACQERDPFGASRCKACEGIRTIEGDMHELARSGLKAADFREMVGYTARDPEGMAGTSGANILYIVDEASGVSDAIFEAIEGNRAGGARILLLSNPTRTSGEFHASHNKKRKTDGNPRGYVAIRISSEDTPNYRDRTNTIPGLATYDWVEEKRAEWGENSPLFQVRVKGMFPTQDANSVVPLFLITEGIERWKDLTERAALLAERSISPSPENDVEPIPAAYEEGRLDVGLDVARFGDDDSALTIGRGLLVYEETHRNGFDENMVAGLVLAMVRKHRREVAGKFEKARVKIDACGGYGTAVAGRLRDYPDEVEVIEVNVAERSTNPVEYHRLRDQVWFAVTDWLKAGGALPENDVRDQELVEPKYTFESNGARRVESKDATKARLGRSPDRADALCLFVYNPPTVAIDYWSLKGGTSRYAAQPGRHLGSGRGRHR